MTNQLAVKLRQIDTTKSFDPRNISRLSDSYKKFLASVADCLKPAVLTDEELETFAAVLVTQYQKQINALKADVNKIAA